MKSGLPARRIVVLLPRPVESYERQCELLLVMRGLQSYYSLTSLLLSLNQSACSVDRCGLV